MKFSILSAAVAISLFESASAHYLFNRVVVDGVMQPAWRYWREHTNTFMPTKGEEMTLDSFRCNKGATLNPNSEVLTVAAGGKIVMRLSTSTPVVTHPGPVHIFMSKAPGDVRQYDGSGDWFKIYQDDICGNAADGVVDSDWCSWQKSDFPVTVPAATPPGDYLVRIEQFGLHGAHVSGGAEVFFGCLQVRVTGNGNGTPGPLVKIPGMYKADSLNFNKYGFFTSYPQPAPAVWDGAAGTSNPATTRSTTSVATTAISTTTRTTTRAAATTAIITTVRTTTRAVTTPSATIPTTTRAATTASAIARTTTRTAAAPSRSCTRTVRKYRRCGGNGYKGPTTCAAGLKCVRLNANYSRCL
ncbi:hypothetical protein TWF281_009563 [Arthrobotrys megalospora]